MNLKKVINKSVRVGVALSPIGAIKSVSNVLKKEKATAISPAPVLSSIGVSVAKPDVFTSVVHSSPIPAVNIQPAPESGGGIVGGGFSGVNPGLFPTSLGGSTNQDSSEGDFVDDGVEATKTQKKVRGWLQNWLPTLQVEGGMTNYNPIFITGGVLVVCILLFKFIKK